MQGSIHFSLNGRHLSNLMYDSEFSYVEVCSEINMTYRIIELVTSLDRLFYSTRNNNKYKYIFLNIILSDQ